jgi:hypothetical protein
MPDPELIGDAVARELARAAEGLRRRRLIEERRYAIVRISSVLFETMLITGWSSDGEEVVVTWGLPEGSIVLGLVVPAQRGFFSNWSDLDLRNEEIGRHGMTEVDVVFGHEAFARVPLHSLPPQIVVEFERLSRDHDLSSRARLGARTAKRSSGG